MSIHHLNYPEDEKYVVIKTEALSDLLDEDIWMYKRILGLAVKDAVVIRRQDFFASPALATYANCIALVAVRESDPKVKADLVATADYFERQAQLAAEEGYKLPDP